MTTNYYGLVSGLQCLFVGKYSDLSLLDFREWLSSQITPEDYYQVLLLFYSYDNRNLVSIIKNDELDNDYGNLSENELRKIIKTQKSDDVFIASLLEQINLNDDKVSSTQLEQEITQHYFNFISEHGISFLRNWSKFEITMRNLTTVYAQRNLGIENGEQFIEGGHFSGLELKRINVSDLDRQYPHLKRKYDALEISNPIDRKLKVDEIKWSYLDDNTFFNYFTIERILAYVLKLKDLEIWKSINENEGAKLLNNYIEQVNSELETLIK